MFAKSSGLPAAAAAVANICGRHQDPARAAFSNCFRPQCFATGAVFATSWFSFGQSSFGLVWSTASTAHSKYYSSGWLILGRCTGKLSKYQLTIVTRQITFKIFAYFGNLCSCQSLHVCCCHQKTYPAVNRWMEQNSRPAPDPDFCFHKLAPVSTASVAGTLCR